MNTIKPTHPLQAPPDVASEITVTVRTRKGRLTGYAFNHGDEISQDAARALVAEAIGLRPSLDAAPDEPTDAHVAAAARRLADRHADLCNVNKDDNWAIYGDSFIEDTRVILEALEAAQQPSAGGA